MNTEYGLHYLENFRHCLHVSKRNGIAVSSPDDVCNIVEDGAPEGPGTFPGGEPVS